MHARIALVGSVLMTVLGVCLFSLTSSALANTIVISQIQTGTSEDAKQEFIVLHNNSPSTVDISGWCVNYSSASDKTVKNLACFEPTIVAGSSDIILASNEFIAVHPDTTKQDISFEAGLNNTGGHIRLFDAAEPKNEIDKVGWGDAVSPEMLAAPAELSGQPLLRKSQQDFVLQDTDNNRADFIDQCSNILGNQNELPNGYVVNETNNCSIPICPNLKDSDGKYLNYLPDNYMFAPDGVSCLEIPPKENATILISELLPNATSYDTGNEFIELYNPNNRPVNLQNYQLGLGPEYSQHYLFGDQTIAAGQYKSFSDTETGLTLPNSSANLRLTSAAGNVVDQTDSYTSPAENMAWARINNSWQYTNQPTPGAANKASVVQNDSAASSQTKPYQSCGAGKFRNPATNRCKSITSATSTLTPCQPDQRRNPETNRCKSIFASTSGLKQCQADQFRNPATNRCKSLSSSSNSLKPCQANQTRNPATNRCRKIGAGSSNLKPCAANQERNSETNRCRKKAVLAASAIKDVASKQTKSQTGWLVAGGAAATIGGYGAWEWRSEMAGLGRKVLKVFGKSPPLN